MFRTPQMSGRGPDGYPLDVHAPKPPRNLHGFRLNQDYNRCAAFLTPGIFESFFVMGVQRHGLAVRPPQRLAVEAEKVLEVPRMKMRAHTTAGPTLRQFEGSPWEIVCMRREGRPRSMNAGASC